MTHDDMLRKILEKHYTGRLQDRYGIGEATERYLSAQAIADINALDGEPTGWWLQRPDGSEFVHIGPEEPSLTMEAIENGWAKAPLYSRGDDRE